MIRTRFYQKILDLAVERKRRRLMQRKAEREFQRNSAESPNDYRIGLMICLDKFKLGAKDKEFCDRLRDLEAGDNATLDDLKNLYRLIGRLIPRKRALTICVADPTEMDDGGSAILNGGMRKAG